MSDFLSFISKIPFLRLLLPAVTAILVSDFLFVIPFPLVLCLLGAGAMLISLFVSEKQQFIYRWFFGIGLFLFVFGLFSTLYQQAKSDSDFSFPENNSVACVGTVVDIPQVKPRSFACNVQLNYPIKKKIVVYLQKEEKEESIGPGDELFFVAEIQPFKNFGNPDDFDYARFMRNKGFSGSTYLSSANWYPTGRENISLHVFAQRIRKSALEFYRLFQLDDDAYSFISALTLGYKHDLANEIQEAFRSSGTSHVLAVSGLHVAIIYGIFIFLFSFIGKGGKRLVLKQTLIILALWFYALLTGLSPSVLRATIMLTIVSIGLAGGRKGFTYNTLAAAAFIILAFSPMSLFDVGFQMSFIAVFAILYFNPFLKALYFPKNKVDKYMWNLFTVSTSAQLGVFPVALYYFGTFPTYFFIANLLVVPMIGVIICACIPMILIVLLQQSDFILFDWLFQAVGWVLSTLINMVFKVVYFIDALPYSQLAGKHISAPQVLLLMIISITVFTLFKRRSPARLITVLACVLLLVLSEVDGKLSRNSEQLAVFNTPYESDIGAYVNGKRIYFDIEENGFAVHPSKTILRLSNNFYRDANVNNPMEVDVLILSRDRTFSIEKLNTLFNPKQIVLDSSLPQYSINRLTAECTELGISVHDVTRDGAFLINF